MPQPLSTVGVILVLLGLAIDDRGALIRTTIKRNLHFSLHCWCVGPDERTVRAVTKVAKTNDVPILEALLSDPDDRIADGASLVLAELANRALDALRPSLSIADLSDPSSLKMVDDPALEALRRAQLAGP